MKAKSGFENIGTRTLTSARLENVLPVSVWSTDWISRDLARAYFG